MCNPGGRASVVGLVLVLWIGSAASAQIVQSPPRGYRGLFGAPQLDPNRARQEVWFGGSLLGSYDDNLSPVSSNVDDVFTPRPNGVSGVGDARIRYFRGRETSSIELGADGTVFSYRGLGLAPEYAGGARGRWTAPIGRRNTFTAAQGVRFEPFYALGGFAPLFPTRDVQVTPIVNSPTGFSVRRSRLLDSSVSVVHRWPGRDLLSLSSNYNSRAFDDNFGNGRTVSAAAEYDHVFSRFSTLRAAYRYADSTNLNEDGVNRPVTHHTMGLGYLYDKPLSLTRRFSFSFGAGATRVHTLAAERSEPLEYWTPSGYVTTRFDWARSWSVWLDYSRRVAVLEGLTVDPYTIDSVMLRTGGLVHGRIELVASGGLLSGQAAPGTPDSTFDTYSAATQLRCFVTRRSSLIVAYTLYAHRLDGVNNLPQGVATRSTQNTVRVGLTLDLPVSTRYTDRVRP